MHAYLGAQPPPTHHLASAGVIQAVGIFALSATAHSTLPALRRWVQGAFASISSYAAPDAGRECAEIGAILSSPALLLAPAAMGPLCCRLPSCSAMHKPSQFPLALAASFTVMLAAYSALAAAGYWYWVGGCACGPGCCDCRRVGTLLLMSSSPACALPTRLRACLPVLPSCPAG